MAILVSNDDGVHAQGLKALADALAELDEVVIVAPDRERSASSHSLTLHRPLRIKELGPRFYAIDGTPTDCVLLGVKKLLPSRPRLLVSGINHGANLADDVSYSGTVSAALEGTILGVPSLAVSLVSSREFHFETAARFARSLAEQILSRGLPLGTYLNVNVPGDLVGYQSQPGVDLTYEMTRLGKRHYGDDIIVEKTDPRGKKYYWIGGEQDGFERNAGTDCDAVLRHVISVTPLKANFTNEPFLGDLDAWRLDGFRHRASTAG